MNSCTAVFLLLLMGKLNLSPNCNNLANFGGISVCDKFINHLSLISFKGSLICLENSEDSMVIYCNDCSEEMKGAVPVFLIV